MTETIELRESRPSTRGPEVQEGFTTAPGDKVGVSQAGAITQGRDRLVWGVWAVAVVFVAVELVVSGHYGFHQDELYFLAAGAHPALGYVDQGPLAPMLAWLTSKVAADPTAIRVLPALAGGGVVICAGTAARLLGGRRFAQVLAAVATACAPVLLGASHLAGTTAYDLLAWAGALTLVLAAVTRQRPRLWLAAGLAVGVGLENKDLLALGMLALFLGLLLTKQRRVLATRWPWLGLALALAIWAPNLYWQATHYLHWSTAQGFPEVAMAHALQGHNATTANYALGLPLQLLDLGILAVPLAGVGLVRLVRQPANRFLGLAALALLAYVLVDIPGRAYYTDGLLFLVFAAGAVAVEARLMAGKPVHARARRAAWVGAPLLGVLVALPLSIPVLPVADLHVVPGLHQINPDIGNTVGWPQLTAQVAGAYRTIAPAQRAAASIFTDTYGEAGAIAWYGPAYQLPYPLSGHNNFALWGPGSAPDAAVVVVGSLGVLRAHFATCTLVSTFSPPDHVPNDQIGTKIWRCEGPDAPWSAIWPQVRHLN